MKTFQKTTDKTQTEEKKDRANENERIILKLLSFESRDEKKKQQQRIDDDFFFEN